MRIFSTSKTCLKVSMNLQWNLLLICLFLSPLPYLKYYYCLWISWICTHVSMQDVFLVFVFYFFKFLNWWYSMFMTFCIISSAIQIIVFIFFALHQRSWQFLLFKIISSLFYCFYFVSIFFWLLRTYKSRISFMKILLCKFFSYDVIQHQTKK